MQGSDGEASMEECGIHIIEGQSGGGEEERNSRQLVTGKQTFFQRDLLLPWCISLLFFFFLSEFMSFVPSGFCPCLSAPLKIKST